MKNLDGYPGCMMVVFEMSMSSYDFAGLEEKDFLRHQTYLNANVILMCFSIANHESFENIEKKWLREVQYFCPEGNAIIQSLWSSIAYICKKVSYCVLFPL